MCCHSSVVERVLGKDEVVGSTPTGSFFLRLRRGMARPGIMTRENGKPRQAAKAVAG